MATYNFKKQAEVYLFHDNKRYRLDVTEDLSFSQTFTDKTYPQKTLHEPHKQHEASSIKKAHAANFSFTVPMITQDSLDVIFDLLVNYKSGTYTLDTFDLYIKLPNDIYKLEKCVITNGTFIIEKLENLKLTIAGEASKLLKTGVTLPTSGIQSYTGGGTPQMIDYLRVAVGSDVLSTAVYKVSVELQNDVSWNPYQTVNAALSSGTLMYPSEFTLKKRTLSGSIGQYITSDSEDNVQTFAQGVTLLIKAGKSSTQGFRFNLVNCSFTNRLAVGETFTQAYDWKMNDNPVNLGSKITLN
jgi:hypothetical protein